MKEKLSNDKLAIAGPHILYCRCSRHLPIIHLVILLEQSPPSNSSLKELTNYNEVFRYQRYCCVLNKFIVHVIMNNDFHVVRKSRQIQLRDLRHGNKVLASLAATREVLEYLLRLHCNKIQEDCRTIG